MNWNKKNVLVTGGASFIGSHLVEALIKRGAKYIRVIDNLSSGKLSNIQEHLESGKVHFILGNLLNKGEASNSLREIDIVFHLAADHGGRGYVDLHDAQCSTNLILDGLLIKAAHEAKVEKFCLASSGCVYPNFKQMDLSEEIYLKEEDVGPPYDSDNIYGYAKLMAELTLKAYYKQYGMKSASLRFFTVYGERGVENHAVMAMIARAFIEENPFEIWGDGCLLPDSQIISNPGIKAIAELKSGESVLGEDGNYHQILKTLEREVDENIFIIKAMGIPEIKLTANHRLLVTRLLTECNRSGKNQKHYCKPNCWCLSSKYHKHHKPHPVRIEKKWITAENLGSHDFLMIPRIKIEKPQIIKISNYVRNKCSLPYRQKDFLLDENFAYFLGWYTAEGWTNWVTNKHNDSKKARVALALGWKEKKIVDSLVKCIKNLGYKPHWRKRPSVYEVSFSATHLARWLDENTGRKAKEKRVAPQIFKAEKNLIEIYLRALFEGDGHRFEYMDTLTSVSEKLLRGVQILLAKLGYCGSMHWFRKKYENRGFAKGEVDQGVIMFTKKKQRRYWVDENFVYVPIDSVSKIPYEGFVYDIETEDHSFCGPVVLHNSQIRNWTHVTDIVEGMVLAAEKVDDAQAINLGTNERIRVFDAARAVVDYVREKYYPDYEPKFKFLKNMPTGPLNRTTDYSLATEILGWEPKIRFHDGVKRVTDWYFKNKNIEEVKRIFDKKLLTEKL